MPDWGREGETWRVEPERGGWVATGDDALGGVCSVKECYRSSIVIRPARTYRGSDYVLCEVHVREQRMWIEDGRLVSWALRR
jgi:hypothetical protein